MATRARRNTVTKSLDKKPTIKTLDNMGPDDLPTIITWTVENIDWSDPKAYWSPHFIFKNLKWSLNFTVASDTAHQTDPLGPTPTYPVTQALNIENINKPYTLSSGIFLTENLESPILGIYSNTATFDQPDSSSGVQDFFDALYYIGKPLPTKFIIGVQMYPTLIELNDLTQIPIIRGSTWLHLHEEDGPSVRPPPEALPYPFPTAKAYDQTDVTIKLQDGYIKAHSLPLRYNFPGSYFSEVLEQPLEQEQETRTIRIRDIDHAVFKHVLRYIYTGHVVLDNSLLFDLYK
ncbi:hypothetical protein HDV00_000781 [Rhizophlyctis rosea]|nr:hypothetical protein HDV00_000781 [Rhizophlyctis rosea]